MSNDDHASGFCGAFGSGEDIASFAQELTPVRQTVEEVVADLKHVVESRRKLRIAQIIDLGRLEPIEPMRATMARLT
jgi:hypothetical protein